MRLRTSLAAVIGTAVCLSQLLSPNAIAQAKKGTIMGTVVDSGGGIVPSALLRLEPLGLIGSTDAGGAFSLPEVAAGDYTLSVSYIGFETLKVPVSVSEGQGQSLRLQLKVAPGSEQVLVTAERPHGEAEAINIMRTSENILQVLPTEVIRSLPNANVADAIGRLPSVTLYRIEGEGVYIQVRGTEPRLTNVTVDGITLPSPEPTVRQVRLDVVPSDLVEAVEINKTLSANQDASGIGGSVNLRTKEAGERPTFNLFGDGGRTNIENGRGSYDFGGTVGKRFLKEKRFGVLFNGAYDYNGRGIDNIQPTLDPRSTFAAPFYDQDTIREYRYYRYRYGFAGSTDYRFNDHVSVFARGLYSNFKDWGDKWYFAPISAKISSAGVLPSAAVASSSPKFYTSSKRPNASVSSVIVGARDVHSNYWINFVASASRSFEVSSAGNPKADFSWTGPAVFCNYQPSAQSDPLRPHFGNCDGPNSTITNPNNYTFADITTSRGLTAQMNLSATLSVTRTYSFAGHFGQFETGFKFANAHKYQDATETVYDGWSTKAGSGTPTIAQLQSDFNNTDYYNGSYLGGNFTNVSDFNLVQAFTLKNYSGFVDGIKTAAASYPNIFNTIEQVPAGYIMNTIDFNRLHIQTGLRFEATNLRTTGYNVQLYKAGSAVCGGPTNTGCGIPTAITQRPGYIDALPSAQLRYRITNDQALRMSFSRGIARPDVYQLVPYVTEDNSASPIAVTVGNPSLRPTHANNYDVLYENFLRPLGMIQAGVFFKQLNAPQALTTLPAGTSTTSLPPALQAAAAQYPGDSITQVINGQNAWLYGFELSFQQHMTYLPGVLRGLGVSANYSYTASREKGLPLRSDSPTLVDQAPHTFNVSPTYDTKRFSARVGLAYNGSSLFSYNYTTAGDLSGLGTRGPSGDIYTLSHFQVDAQASYRVFRGFSAIASGLNLNNQVFGYYTGSPVFVNQREFYKPTYSLGMRYSFAQAR